MSQSEIQRCVDQLAASLSDLGLRFASAESCTGGWIAKCCTDKAGSSSWFDRGLVTYSNEAKMEMLGVKLEALERFGAVSEAVACQMAAGACHSSNAQVAAAVTGIAGPGGGTPEKPVGTVCFAWCLPENQQFSETVCFAGNRDSIRRQSVHHALAGLVSRLG
jgi:nicotinamide-nucleotide amidase